MDKLVKDKIKASLTLCSVFLAWLGFVWLLFKWVVKSSE